MKKIIDVSLPVSGCLPRWPGSPDFELTTVAKLDTHGFNETKMTLSNHLGTHVDAPAHFLGNDETVEKLSLDILVGDAVVADFQGVGAITAERLENLSLPAETTRLLLKTDNSTLWAEKNNHFFENFVAVTLDGARWLVENGIRLVGIDYLSIQRFKDSHRTHEVLLEKGVIIIEGLNLFEAEAGKYELVCLPMNVVGAEAAPVRAILTQS